MIVLELGWPCKLVEFIECWRITKRKVIIHVFDADHRLVRSTIDGRYSDILLLLLFLSLYRLSQY